MYKMFLSFLIVFSLNMVYAQESTDDSKVQNTDKACANSFGHKVEEDDGKEVHWR